MDSVIANAYLQGRESLAVAIARGQARCSRRSEPRSWTCRRSHRPVEPDRAWIELSSIPHLPWRGSLKIFS